MFIAGIAAVFVVSGVQVGVKGTTLGVGAAVRGSASRGKGASMGKSPSGGLEYE